MKADALDIINEALKQAQAGPVPPRVMVGYLETIRDDVMKIEELKRARPKPKAAKP